MTSTAIGSSPSSRNTRRVRQISVSGRRTGSTVDVQLVVAGVERMGYANIGEMREREPYDPARDAAFFEPGGEFVTIRAGTFAILGPEDVHSPGHAAGEPSLVRKIVVKAIC